MPLIRRLVTEGCDSIPLTDDRMTRFWITLEQGIDFVLSSAAIMKGGEIFVPKVPSMTVIDMMEALAPGVPRDIIGIRPGEKLHELLISEDDTAAVAERNGRYVICPSQDENVQAQHEAEGATVIPAGFQYASNTNDEWLDADGLVRLLASV